MRYKAKLSQQALADLLKQTRHYVIRHEDDAMMTFWDWVRWCEACETPLGQCLKDLKVKRRRKKRTSKGKSDGEGADS